MADQITFSIPWLIGSKKNRYAVRKFKGFASIMLSTEAKKEELAIRDCARGYVAYCNGRIDEANYEELLLNARKYRFGEIYPKHWAIYLDRLGIDSSITFWHDTVVEVLVRLFPEPKGPNGSGVTEITIKRLRMVDPVERRRTADVDGALTTVMDALQGLFYDDDKLVDRAVTERHRLHEVPAGMFSIPTQELPK